MSTGSTQPGAAAGEVAARSRMQAGDFLTFRIDAVEYGIDLAYVREVREVREMRSREPVDPRAGTPSALGGSIDVRGAVVPFVELLARIDSAGCDRAHADAVVILGRSAPVAAIVVDNVRDVLALLPGNLRPLAETARRHDAACVLGEAMRDERNIVVIDLECVLARAGVTLE